MISSFKHLFSGPISLLTRFYFFISNPPRDLVRKINILQAPFIIILTLVPIINIANIVATSGENNISNDVVFWVDLVDKLLNGKSSLMEFVTRSFFYQHFIPLHITIELINAYLFDWNVKITLFFGFFLYLVKLALLFDLFTYKYYRNPLRWVVLPFLSAMVFSNMEVTTFTGQNTATLIGMSMVGAVLSIWGIIRFQNQAKGVLFCVLGGLISTWSFALGLIVWPITLLGMILSGYRKPKLYLLWLLGGVILVFPYFYFMILNPTKTTQTFSPDMQSLLNIKFIINMLGRPLVNLWTFDMTRQYLITGVIGVGLAFACLVIFATSLRKKGYEDFIAPFLISTLGLGGVWMVSIGRPSLASWYITLAWPFWQGIIGFSFILLMEARGKTLFTLYQLFKKTGAFLLILIFGILYARSNIGNDVYGFLLYSRTPASASCLRNYQIAPTYCESLLFQWPIQRPEFIFELGSPLAKNQLSANGQQQEWSLQGDFIFNRVEVNRYPNTTPIGWYEGLTGMRRSWFGVARWHHLDLMLHSPNSIKWTVDFPENMEKALLKTAIGIHPNSGDNAQADGATFQVIIEQDKNIKDVIFEKSVPVNQRTWIPINFDLSSYRGKKVTIEFTSLPGENNVGDLVMVQYPVIDLTLAKQKKTDENASYTPENSDLFQGFKSPEANDLIWDGTDLTIWRISNMEVVKKEKPGFYSGGEDPQFQLINPVDICIGDYSQFYVKFATPPGTPRVAQIFYQLNDNQPISEEHSFSFTTIADGTEHMYTYPTRLLDLDIDSNAKLIGIRFDPTANINKNDVIQFTEFGLLRGEGASMCK